MTDLMNIPELETLDYHSSFCKCPDCEKKSEPKPEQLKTGVAMFANKDGGVLANPEQPNQQIMLIGTIQGLTTAILNDISKLPESELKDQAYDDMNTFETGILFKLQKEYE